MSPLTSLLTAVPAQALAWALVHFLWQGAALALLALVVMRWVTTTASARYLVGIATMAAMFAAPLVTFVAIGRAVPTDTADLAMVFTASRVHLDAAASGTAAGLAPLALPFIIGAWLLGVVLLSVRLFGGWLVTRRLVHRALGPVAPEIDALARRVADRLALRQLVRVVESSAVSAPILIGWLKPVVLLPAAALSGLTPSQLEGLLAHELAHIRRHDYLVNLLQSVVETLLFYHPAVWWLSKQIRAEREHCCDDLAVEVCDRLVYVSALTDLAAMTTPRLALGAADGSLLGRVRRILDDADVERRAPGSLALVVALLIAVGTTVSMALAATPLATAGMAATGATDLTPRFDVRLSRADQSITGTGQSPAADPLEALRRQLIDAEKELEALRRQQDALQRQKADADFTRRIDQATLEIGVIRAERDRAKEAVANGLNEPGALAALEARLAVAELGLGALVDERTFQTSMADLERRRSETDRLRERVVQEYGEALDKRKAETEADALKRQQATELAQQLERKRAEMLEAERRASVQQSNDAPVRADLIYRQGPGVVDPRLKKEVAPTYTREAMAAKIQGTVVIEAIIRKDGTVDDARVTKSLDKEHGLDAEALKAASQWLFEPATVKGQAVDYAATIELSFRLK